MLVAVPPILTFYLNIVHFPTQYVWPSKINARAKVWSPKTWGSKKSKFFGGGSLFNMNSYNIPPIYYTSSIKKYEYSKNPKTKILDVNLVPWLAARMTPSFPSRNRFPPAMSRVRPCICISIAFLLIWSLAMSTVIVHRPTCCNCICQCQNHMVAPIEVTLQTKSTSLSKDWTLIASS